MYTLNKANTMVINWIQRLNLWDIYSLLLIKYSLSKTFLKMVIMLKITKFNFKFFTKTYEYIEWWQLSESSS